MVRWIVIITVLHKSTWEKFGAVLSMEIPPQFALSSNVQFPAHTEKITASWHARLSKKAADRESQGSMLSTGRFFLKFWLDHGHIYFEGEPRDEKLARAQSLHGNTVWQRMKTHPFVPFSTSFFTIFSPLLTNFLERAAKGRSYIIYCYFNFCPKNIIHS